MWFLNKKTGVKHFVGQDNESLSRRLSMDSDYQEIDIPKELKKEPEKKARKKPGPKPKNFDPDEAA